MKILIVNGPNLNLLGTREPGIYGSASFDQYLPQLQAQYPDVEIEYYQSNVEGELINKMQEVGFLRRHRAQRRSLHPYLGSPARLHPFSEMPCH